jgi:hypothetical protein
MDEYSFQGFIFKALLWGITYYFVRRILNPTADPDDFKSDAIYGTITAFLGAILFNIINFYVLAT